MAVQVDEQPSPEIIDDCMEVVAAELIKGRIEPESIPPSAPSADTVWLDALEREIFGEASATSDAIERASIRCEHGAVRLARHYTHDDAAAVGAWCERALSARPANPRQKRLLEAFASRAAILPANVSRTIQ
jgi:hypothetical protein